MHNTATTAADTARKFSHGGNNISQRFVDVLQVEDMPASRCTLSGIVLPNNHAVLLGGQKVRCLALVM
jgi:hypothetical protein